ncbi:MAG TPA: hypothetical protein VFT71_01640 [Candidatus Nitrosocosmicus sp.]|nr:hypothetical protein [Candidatus Nitrosocosmicus sp.]
MKVNILVIIGISLALVLNTGSSSIYGQNFTNQTSGQNNTQQQTEQQLQQANQIQQQSNQSKQQDPKMNEKLLNYTNAAILALNDDNTTAAQDSLQQIQNALINASGKQVVIVPAPAVPSSDDSDNGESG